MMLKSNLLFSTLFLLAYPAISFSCSGSPQDPLEDFTPVLAFPNLRFDLPVFLTHSGDGSNRIFVVEQDGVIKVFPNSESASQATTFLNIDGRVTSGGEMGLLGLAFHPNYASNGFFYVNYTTEQNGPRRTVISRFSVQTGNPDAADPNSELILLEFNQPFSNHNGGMMQFGPDGYLYIATGDGGSGGDPQNNAQNRANLLGKILRIDVDHPSGGRDYGIPPDNPYAGNTQGFREEIFAYGLRNPWRFSIDFPTGQIWAGDVGQQTREEIDLIENGNNYGWRIMEGNLCFNPPNNCDQTGLTLPVLDYDRSLGFSITGGYVYRGANKPTLRGAYIYADFGSGRIWMLRYENGAVTENAELFDASFNISSFGVDENNELYILDYSSSGAVYRFQESPTTVKDENENLQPHQFILEQNYPNPFSQSGAAFTQNPRTTIRYSLQKLARVEVAIFNSLGQKIRTLVDDMQGPGEFQIQWDGKDERGNSVASGVYLYRLKTGENFFTRTMTLVR
jgi:glucose/arabinose dehydrogenase